MVKLLDAMSAKSMAAVDQNSGNSLANVVLERAELADVKSTRFIVKVHNG